MSRKFIIRREYFGAYVFDRESQLDYIFDKESANAFKVAFDDVKKLDDRTYENMVDFDFITNDGIVNFDYFENEVIGEIFSAPIVVHFPYTYKCNLNCKHCFSKTETETMELTLSQKISVLDELEKIGVCKIMIGGGEPFICSDFIVFLKEAEKRGFVIKVFTNGLCFDNQLIDDVSKIKLGGLSISVDSTNRESFQKIRGIDGLQIVLENIKKLVSVCPFPITISTTVGKYNLDDWKCILKIAKECGVFALKIRPIRPTGNAKINNDILTTADEYANYLKEIQSEYDSLEYNKYFKLDLNWGSGKIVVKNSCLNLSDIPNPYGEFGCIAAKDILNIHPDGTVVPCGFLPDIKRCRDNVIKSRVIDIWKNSKNFNYLRNLDVNDTCYNCQYYGNCRGGCPARSLYLNLGYSDVDPWCPKKYFPIKL